MAARIEQLRRRIDKDPASIVFAQLAEEHRRAGDYEDAIRVCRAGLVHHPGYLSARVTLGRALLATGALEDAQAELEQVLRAAPDNLGATRALDELRQKRDAPIRDQGSGIRDQGSGFGGAETRKHQSFATRKQLPRDEFQNLEPLIPDPESLIPDPESPIPVSDPVLVELESWLAAIVADRQRRSA